MDSGNSIKCQSKAAFLSTCSLQCPLSQPGTNHPWDLWISAEHWKQAVCFLKIMVTCRTPPPGNSVKSLTCSYFHGSTTLKNATHILNQEARDTFWKYNKAGSWTADVAAPQILKHVEDTTCMKTGFLPPIKNSDCPQAWWLQRKDTDGNSW